MAKKKNENTLQYLQMPLPEGRKYSKMTKLAFGGLNKRYEHDSGELTMEQNISTKEYPYLTPSERYLADFLGYEKAISMFGFDNFLVVVYAENFNDDKTRVIKLDYIVDVDKCYTGVLKEKKETDDGKVVYVTKEECETPRSIVQFNQYIQSNDIINGEYKKHLLIFPDKKHMPFFEDDIEYEVINDKNIFTFEDMDVEIKDYYNDKPEIDESGATVYPPPDTASHNCYYRNTYKHKDTNFGTDIYKWVEYETVKEDDDGKWIPDGGTTHGWKVSIPPNMPDIKYATVHSSRLFGVSDDCVYASGFNDYTNWNYDTADEYNDNNAWMSRSQSNTKADGNFTGIINYQGHVVCFKRDFMHEIYNTKNPFRIVDIYAEGTIDNRTLQDVDGKLIFVSEDEVKIYTGSNPRIISHNLNMPKYSYAVSGTDNRNYYLYCEGENKLDRHLYVYDTYMELWSERVIESRVVSFAHNQNGMYMFCTNGVIYMVNTGRYYHDWSFETDLVTNGTVDIKHIKKIQMLVEHDSDAKMKVFILYDDEEFDKLSDTEAKKRLVYNTEEKTRYGKYPIRIKPRKTANYGFKLHVEGYEYVKLYGLEICVESGGDMYV